jgi:type IV secretion system protein VirB6
MNSCAAVTDMGVVRAVLTTVDCNTRNFAQMGYESLTAANSSFQTALTLFLTIYIAVIGYRLLFGTGARLSDSPGIALKIGAVLALLTSWNLFQALVFDVAQRAPIQIASLISAPMVGQATSIDPAGALQTAFDQLSGASAAFSHPPKSIPDATRANYVAASQVLALAANTLFVASAGLIAMITIAIGLLTATGPLFIALFLFFETRGFFVGWVRAMAACAFGLLSTWSLAVLMLRAAQPWIIALTDVDANGIADPRTGLTAAIIVLVFCASQFGLLVLGVMIARGFNLPAASGILDSQGSVPRTTTYDSPLEMISRPAQLVEQLSRHDTSWRDGSRTSTAAGATHSIGLSTAGLRYDSHGINEVYRRPTVTRKARPG